MLLARCTGRASFAVVFSVFIHSLNGEVDLRLVQCDIVILGGSTASLASAITAAEAAPSLQVCFTEITDWPGGQMSAGGVPAIDFGGLNGLPENQPKSFRDAMEFIPGSGRIWDRKSHMGSGSPGACSVSSKCYLPNVFVEGWVFPRLNRTVNLKVFLRTAVVKTERTQSGDVTAVLAVQRTPIPSGPAEWSRRLSDELTDWYSPKASAAFSKEMLRFEGRVFIEATELGDVLATSGLPFGQGIEVPLENSTTYESACGQAQTLTFYMERLASKPAKLKLTPKGGDEGQVFPDPERFVKNIDQGWRHSWSWRRSFCDGNRSLYAVNVGDITQQNLGNDLDTAYLFLPLPQVLEEARSGWHGGLNLTALRMLEDRAYGWFWYMRNTSHLIDSSLPEQLVLNYSTSGTLHGLSKMVYWRDTRRAIGVDGFVLTHPPLRDTRGPTGVHFEDSIALGDYNDDTHHLRVPSCKYPSYLQGRGEGGKPYYIPFRALQVGNSSNLLVAGKTMSQSFHANSNTRLHPSEWTSGVAAGAAAVMMVNRNWSSSEVLKHVSELQVFLNSSLVGQPLEWTGLRGGADGSVCELGRCFEVDASAARQSKHHYNSTVCGTSLVGAHVHCPTLNHDEWLANSAFWERSLPSKISAKQATVLKKSTMNSVQLLPSEILKVQAGANCALVGNATFAGYWLCRHPSEVLPLSFV